METMPVEGLALYFDADEREAAELVRRASQVQRIACHELVHAYTAHLKLPAWLHEGLAMLTVDRFFERPTVKRESRDLASLLATQTALPSWI